MPSTLFSLGSINADFQVRLDSSPGSRETLLAHEFLRLSGGKAANTAYLGAVFGHDSRLLGRVGDDDLAEQVLAPLRDAGVDLGGVSRSPHGATAVSMIMVPPDNKKLIVLAPNANDQWDEDACLRALSPLGATRGRACLALDYEVPAWVVRRAIETADTHGVPVILDPSFPDRLERDLLTRVAALTPNVEEAAALLGEKTLDSHEASARGALRLCDEGVALVCIKLADGGCVLAENGRAHLIPPEPVEPVDTTGAGDAFTGVFAIARLEGREPLEAAAWGVAAANLAVTGYGSQPAYAGRERVEALAGKLLRQARRLA